MEPTRQQVLRANLSNSVHFGQPASSFLYEESGLELLAYLQYSINARLPASRFPKDVVAHLENCKQPYKVKLDSVDHKFKLYFDHWRDPRQPLSSYKRIYQFGLKCLPGMRRESIKWVESRAEDLKIFYEPQRRTRVLRSLSCTPARHEAQTPTKTSTTELTNKSVNKRRQRRSRRTVNSSLVPNITRNVGSMRGQVWSLANKRAQSRSISTQAGPSTPQPCGRERVIAVEIMDSEEYHSSVEETVESPNTIFEAPPTPISTERVGGRSMIAENRAGVRMASHRTTQTMCIESTDLTTQLRIQMEFQALQDRSEIDYWRQRFLQEQATSREFEKSVTILSTKLKKVVDTDEDDSELNLLREIDELREDLTACRAMGLCGQRGDFQDTAVVNASEVAADMAIIQRKIRELLWEYEIELDIEVIGTIGHEDFVNLLQGCFGLTRDKERLQECCNVLQGVSLGQLLCSLVSVAIIKWVFEDDIRFLLARGCLVCPSYHTLIAAQNRRLAEKAAFTTHKVACDDESMANLLIPARAASLGRRLRRCILPFLESQHRSGFMLKDSIGRLDRSALALEEIFKLALQIKVRLVFSTDIFMVKFPPPGTPFSKKEMVYGDESDQVAHQQSHIKLSIGLGLIRYPAADRVFHCNRFVQEEPCGLMPEFLAPVVVI
ncbi:hypothetical protein LTR84_004757 [Exophiala bonariae]|uniref:Uncharacterized protein n=1 Tax=Exophiala bonariae TaxID=1690606 RepID=A0AAV9NQJ7_9EURO|nr:hypothetical protein LTR84_004757 [Exophiala bonariae]